LNKVSLSARADAVCAKECYLFITCVDELETYPMKLAEFFETIYRPKKLHGKSPNTVRLYRITIRHFQETLGRAPTLSDLTDDTVLRHMQRMNDSGRAKATVNKDREQLCVLWRHAFRLGKVDKWPDVPKEIEPIRTPKAWLADDIANLLRTASEQEGMFGPIPRSEWWTALLNVALETGERISALLACEWDWLEGQWLTVLAEVRKGGKRDKRFLLSEETVQLLDRLRSYKAPGNKIFAWFHCRMYVWSLYTELLKQAGLPHGRKDKFHRLRKTVTSPYPWQNAKHRPAKFLRPIFEIQMHHTERLGGCGDSTDFSPCNCFARCSRLQ